ncbi:SUKH-3 domain-containing protein [Streptomyces goshikiensis]|uniref:SUKH-3 domain-containing protein n=1 Tax=Streptomyces goshikiensis TaxID=1942 RepID=UPI00365EA017
MFARPDSFEVVGLSDRGERVAFETADPAEAVALAARLVRDQQGAQSKAPHVWSVEVETVLRGAGWYPGRSIDTTAWRVRLEADGFRIHAAAEDFLCEFGGTDRWRRWLRHHPGAAAIRTQPAACAGGG